MSSPPPSQKGQKNHVKRISGTGTFAECFAFHSAMIRSAALVTQARRATFLISVSQRIGLLRG
jgi:hypothetical protein